MRLIRDLWATSPRRTAVVALFVVLGAAGQATAAAVGGSVLIHRSWTMFTVLAVALAAAVLTDLAVGLIMARLTADWAADVRRRLCRVAFGQDLPTLETTPVGELLDRIDGDVYQVGAELRSSGVRIAQSVAYTVLSIGTTLFVWWPAGVAMIVLTTVLTVALRKPTSKIAAARMAEEEAWSDLAAVMEESIHGQDDVRTTLARPYVLRLYARRASRVLSRGRKVWNRSAAVTSVASGFVRFGIAVVVLAGVWALATDRIDSARLTAVWLLALGFGATVEHTSRMVPELQYALGAWGRVQLLRDSEQEPTGGLPPAPGDLIVRDLTFRYGDAARRPALQDVRLTFTRGRSYALVGRTGSGKSTLAKVLTRAVDVPRGTVFLGGTDLLDLDVEELRKWVAVVPQRTEILAGTLVENIALFDPDLLDAAARAIDELGLSPWVADLPDGLETKLGEGGHVLSAGQEQLVAFARIMVRGPQVVILDEATARLDPVTEQQVQRATARMLHGRIGIIVAHRLSSVRQCDEVVVLADGRVVEAGPLDTSERFAELLATSGAPALVAPPAPVPAAGGTRSGAVAVLEREPAPAPVVTVASGKADPPPLPDLPKARTMWNIFRLATNDARLGLVSVAMFAIMVLLGLDGSVLPWLWADLVDGTGDTLWPAIGIVCGLLLPLPLPYYTGKWFPEWWVRQLLRISLRLVHGQTGPRRVSKHTPAEVVAQGGDTERVVALADNLVDQWICVFVLVSMTVVAGSIVPALFMAGTIVLSGLAATLFGPSLKRSAQKTVAARAAFATSLVSSLSAARTVKLAGATGPVLAHLAKLDRARSDRQRREISVQVWARSTPSLVSGLLPIGAWALLLSGSLSPGATLVAVSTLGSARWFAWTTASLISQLPSARVWTRRTVAMTGEAEYAAAVPGVDLSAGTAPAPKAAPRHPLRRLDLDGFTAVHEDGTVAVRDLDLSVERGQLVLVVGPVGSGKSSLLRALAGIVHHTGELKWNGEPVTEPEMFLRPNQIGYVAQLPRVLSGTVADNIRLGHEIDAASAVSTAQLEHDLAAAGAGLGLLIGHKGTRLSGGQLQRLALARALAPRTELLIADDVSSALDVTTELALWRALREHGVTVIGSTSKRAALTQADRVVVLQDGAAAAQGTWRELEDRWGHLAG
ncbi:ABC transporter ATP-binding protein [Dactylosporangium roseum]|uniref:ABC transporter ATP-binding protein n=1 Tax=Dactylosporangium roseum TaxID=47989 RepID=A0ABY5YW94_9ACTN|nr:ABC transporter ATP-binding protein [Dactylosporangium roseum]UWZ34015.1 ABC transporter ATP-binding protein [Dactylosporangium roseum]